MTRSKVTDIVVTNRSLVKYHVSTSRAHRTFVRMVDPSENLSNPDKSIISEKEFLDIIEEAVCGVVSGPVQLVYQLKNNKKLSIVAKNLLEKINNHLRPNKTRK